VDERRDTERGRRRDAGLPFAEFIEPFIAARGLAPKSRDDYARYLRFFDEFTGHTDLRTALTLENGRGFRERLKERGRTRTPSRNGTMYLKSLASWVAETGTLARPDGGSILDPLKAPKTPRTKRQALTEEDLDAIWAVLAVRPKRERYRAIALVRLL
jgi:integrase